MTTDRLNHTYRVHAVKHKLLRIVNLLIAYSPTQLGLLLTRQVYEVVTKRGFKRLINLCRHFTLLLINHCAESCPTLDSPGCVKTPDPCGLPGLKICKKQLSYAGCPSGNTEGSFFFFLPFLIGTISATGSA